MLALTVLGIPVVAAARLAATRNEDPAQLSALRASSPAACDRTQILVLAHRGTGPGTRPIDGHTFSENTVPAFVEALDLGADGVESDYWPTADGHLVTQHDATLDRMTGGQGRIGEHTWAEVATQRVSGGAHLPSFETVVRLVRARDGHRQQEIKPGAAISRHLLGRMIRTDVNGEPTPYKRLLYTSTGLGTLRRVHMIDPRLPVGLITRSPVGRPALERLPAWLDVVLINLRAADAEYVRLARDLGHAVSVRGVDTVPQLHEAVSLGATRVVTNHPEVLGRAC